MAALESIRKKGGIIVSLAIGLALFAFILGDFVRPKGGRVSNLDVAIVGGQTFNIQKLEAKIEEVSNMYQQQFGQLDDQMRDMAHEQAWQMFISETVMQQSYQKIGLTVSPEELWEIITGFNPPAIIRREFSNQQTGEFDRSMLMNFLKMKDDPSYANYANAWNFLERNLINDRYMQKYSSLVGRGIFVPDFIAENENLEINKKVDFDYVVQTYATIPDSAVTITNEDLKAYYKKHHKQWEQENSRDIEYVVFNIEPSDEDRTAANEWIENIKDEFEHTADPFQFIRVNSKTPADARFLTREQLPVQVADLFDEPVGTMRGPYQDGEALKLVRLAKSENRPDSIKLRQIALLPKEKTQEALNETMQLADSIKTAIEKGANFAELAVKYSADPAAATNNGDYGWMYEWDMPAGSIMEPIFTMKKGEVRIIESNQTVFIMQVADRGAEKKKVQIATLQHDILPSLRTEQILYTQASRFAIENRNEKQFNDAVAAQNLNKRQANNLGENDRQIPGLSSPRAVIRWAYGAKQGQVSDVFTLNNTYVVAMVKNIHKKGFKPINDVNSEIELNVLREKKAEIIISQLAQASKNAQSFSELASNLNLAVNKATAITFSSFSIPGVGVEPQLTGAVSASNEGNISIPVEGTNGVFLFTVNQIVEPDETGKEQAKERLFLTFFNRSKIEQYSGMVNSNAEPVQALRKAANIEDLRSKFY